MIKLIFSLLLCFLPVYSFAQTELTAERTYNQKVYDLGKSKNGRQQKNYKIHTAQIHYKDGKDFKDIDTTLTQDLTTKQWKQFKASYHCSIPEYADDWFEFYNAYEGANHTIKAKPLASHVKGEAFSGKDGHGVIYKDAFGKGIDLKVYAYWHGLKKVIIINEKPAEIVDMSFDFEMDMPTKVKDRQGNQWSKASRLDFKSKTLKIGEEGKESYFHNAMMWDSSKGIGKRENVNIELYTKDGKTYLRKTIPKEFLEKSTYPVYTDHPTNYSPTAGDGYVAQIDTTWDSVHDSLNGDSFGADYTAEDITIASQSAGGIFAIGRGFVPINTAGIDDGATITAAVLYLYQESTINFDNDGDDWINVVGQTSQALTTELISDDFDQCGAIDNPDEGATRIDLGDLGEYQYSAWTLNSTGRGWINKTGVSMFGIREGHDCIDSPIGTDLNNIFMFYSSESDYDPDVDPYLDVTVESGETPRRIIFIQ
jgi:hypothetical protein